MAESVISIVNTICFERPDIIHLGGFWYHFGSLFESLFGTFAKSCDLGPQKAHTEITSKFDEKRSCENSRAGRGGALKTTFKQLEAGGWRLEA